MRDKVDVVVDLTERQIQMSESLSITPTFISPPVVYFGAR